MTFEEWAVDHFDPTQSAYLAAKVAWEARGKLPQERPATAVTVAGTRKAR